MNKREFVTGGMAAVVAVPSLSHAADAPPAPGGLHALLTRTQRLPDLAEKAGADTFEAYIGQRFEVVAGCDAGQTLILRSVTRVSRCRHTEQFDVTFSSTDTPGPAAADGVRRLVHASGQQLALHLESAPGVYTARFNLLA